MPSMPKEKLSKELRELQKKYNRELYEQDRRNRKDSQLMGISMVMLFISITLLIMLFSSM